MVLRRGEKPGVALVRGRLIKVKSTATRARLPGSATGFATGYVSYTAFLSLRCESGIKSFHLIGINKNTGDAFKIAAEYSRHSVSPR